MVTAYKDLRLAASKPRQWPIESEDVLKKIQVPLVWERHDLFPGPGRRLADRVGAPLVISVEAPAVWEAAKWGVKRPLWGRWLERNVEARSLQGADLVSCVSDEVKEKVISMGVPESRAIVSPNRVDSSLFHPDVDGSAISRQYGLEGRRVIGWTGSFRPFHGINDVVAAFAGVAGNHPDTLLMLVGDGLEFENVKQQVAQLGLQDRTILTGRVPFVAIPSFVANFHISLVTASSATGFHYSPLKLREYLAMATPVIAPLAGNLPQLFEEGTDVIFYKPGHAIDLARAMDLLLTDHRIHAALKTRSQAMFGEEGTWKHEMTTVCRKLGLNYTA
jgi:glycosyltransferase involved in cell wall biosynthesis